MQQYGEELIVGPESFGALLSDYNVCSVPSPDNPHPGKLISYHEGLGFVSLIKKDL